MARSSKDQWILIVEDDEDIRDLLVDYLNDHFDGELRIVEAADGVQASLKLEYQKFDCIVTDLNMPKRDGGSFIKEVKNSANNKNCPIVVVTGFPDPHLLDDYPNLHFVEKPVVAEEFCKLVDVQLKLGQLDKRVSADIFNYAVNAARGLTGKLFDIMPKTSAPNQKSAGDKVEGDVFVVTSIKGPHGYCDICFSWSEDFVSQLKKKTTSADSDENVSVGSINVILKFVLRAYKEDHPHEKVLSLGERLATTGNESDLYKAIQSSPGLSVPIKLGDETIWLTMLTKMSYPEKIVMPMQQKA